ncbi:acyltransferase [Roseiconus nitratireducens]|uniref:Acyltransferase n=1 Tax=Roseiconus nitratireducens TaxID=2605748 RepID=A0A5M6D032_9BACT|nr:acyltransferase [Roseiconus nitratireducens]KAA5538899.1 acyltransferase [Roseiconus nitratireducens]
MMRSFRKAIFLRLARLLPATRCYRQRSWLIRKAGFDVDPTARLCGSAQILGTFRLKVGANTFIGHETLITGGDCEILIGASCDISTRVLIIAGTHELTPQNEKVAGPGRSENIVIGDGCWIGANSTILAGVTIGPRSFVAAGATVTRSIPARSMVGGVPARLIRSFSDHADAEAELPLQKE